MSMLTASGAILFAVLSFVACAILGIFICGFIGCAACGGIRFTGMRSVRRAPSEPVTAPDIRPPTEAELRVDPIVFDHATKALLRKMAVDATGFPEWIVTSVLIVLTLCPLLFAAGEVWSGMAILSALCLAVFVPWLALRTLRDARRARELRQGQFLMGILETLSARYSPGGDGEMYEVELALIFRSPAGKLLGRRFSEMVAADVNHPDRFDGTLGGPADVPMAFDGCPRLRERVPVVVLYVDEHLYHWAYLHEREFGGLARSTSRRTP